MLKYGKLGKETGWINTETNEWLPSSAWSRASVGDQSGIFNKQTNEFIQIKTPTQRIASTLGSGMGQTALETGGALLGGVLAAPANLIAPGVAEAAGASLGALGGKQLARALRQYGGVEPPTRTTRQALTQTAQDLPMALAEGFGGKALEGIPGIAAAGLRGLGRGAGRAAKSSAGKIVNLPAKEGLRRVAGQPEFESKAEMLSSQLLKDRPKVTQAGLKQYKGDIASQVAKRDVRQAAISQDIKNRNKLMASGVSEKQLAQNALDTVKKELGGLDKSDVDYRTLQRLSKRIQSDIDKMPEAKSNIDRLQNIKKVEQSMANYEKAGLSKTAAGRFKEIHRKALAHEYRNAIEGLDEQFAKKYAKKGIEPLVGKINKDIGAKSELYDRLEEAVYNANNRDRSVLFGLLRWAKRSGGGLTSIIPKLPENMKAQFAYILDDVGQNLSKVKAPTSPVAKPIATTAAVGAGVSAENGAPSRRRSWGTEEGE